MAADPAAPSLTLDPGKARGRARPWWWPSLPDLLRVETRALCRISLRPFIIKEPERNKAEVKQGPMHQGEHRGSRHCSTGPC